MGLSSSCLLEPSPRFLSRACLSFVMSETENVATVQALVKLYQAGDLDGYLAGCADEFEGSVLGGVVDGGEEIVGKEQLTKFVKETIPVAIDIVKFEPSEFAATGDTVFFVVDWSFALKGKETVHTKATVRTVVKDKKVVAMYHLVNGTLVKKMSKDKAANGQAAVAD